MRTAVGWIAAMALIVGGAGVAAADDEGPNFSIGASTSYVFDANDPTPQGGSDPLFANTVAYSTGEQDESFNIDMIQIGVSGSRGMLGYSAKIDTGDLAAAAGDSVDGDVALQEAFISLDGGDIGARVGRVPTPIGYEVLEPWGNAHVSRSWGWFMQPINHDGLMVDGSIDVLDFSLGVVNNFTVADPAGNDIDDEKGVVAAVGAGLSDQVNLYVSGIYTEEGNDSGVALPNGSDEIGLINGIISGVLDPDGAGLRYAVEGNWVEHDFSNGAEATGWNVALYGGADVGPMGLDLRFDWADFDGRAGAGGGSPLTAGGGGGAPTSIDWNSIASSNFETDVWSLTVTGSVALGQDVDFRLEYRHDESEDNIFLDESQADDSLDVVQAQVVWHPGGSSD